MKCVIGIDYGTQAARAVLANVENGEVLASHTVKYAHELTSECLIHAGDYDSALLELMTEMARAAAGHEIAGVGVDATSLTLMPVDCDGVALSDVPELAGHPQAMCKLWKRHAAQKQADEALALAKERGEKFLERTGGSISSEWMLPKLMEMYDEDPVAYERLDRAFDLCEYLTFRLTGDPRRSCAPLSFKCCWAEDLGMPDKEYLDLLRPGLGEKYAHVLRGEVDRPCERTGYLTERWQNLLGVDYPVPVGAGMLDGHTALVVMGALGNGDCAMVVGTSGVLSVQTDRPCRSEGTCGVAYSGITPDLWGVDAGQACVGEMLGWFVDHMAPAGAAEEAARRGVSVHTLMTEKITEPWKNQLLVMDWWNGSRNAPCDLNLRGSVIGMSLETRPEDIYLAMIQGLACGAREVMEQCVRNGAPVRTLRMSGGIARKNPLFVDQYANIFGMPIDVVLVDEGPAMGSAIFAAVAAGVYATPEEACRHMGAAEFKRYEPDPAHRNEYEAIYRRSHLARETMRRLRDDLNTIG